MEHTFAVWRPGLEAYPVISTPKPSRQICRQRIRKSGCWGGFFSARRGESGNLRTRWRRGGDLNPRGFYPCRFSRPVPSATRPPLRCGNCSGTLFEPPPRYPTDFKGLRNIRTIAKTGVKHERDKRFVRRFRFLKRCALPFGSIGGMKPGWR